MKAWRGEDLVGHYHMSYKIDGINVLVEPGGYAKSKAGKVFANLECLDLPEGEYEFYRDSWAESVSLLKNSSRADEIKREDLYNLYPRIDSRLSIGEVVSPTAEYLTNRLKEAVEQGYEGLILRSMLDNSLIKVKTEYTIDLLCIDYIDGKGKTNFNSVGVLVFQFGGNLAYISAGITKKDALRWFRHPQEIIGTIFEIGYSNITPSGALRHPRIIRQRFDKNNESLE